ncbi:MAG: glycoside hydrolase family 31 protein [bacterium]
MRWTLVFLVAIAACDDTTSPNSPQTNGVDAGEDTSDATTPDASPACAPESAQTFQGNGWTFTLETDGAWAATHGETVLRGPSPCDGGVPIQVMSGEPGVKTAFGNFKIDLWADTATWAAPTSVTGVVRNDGLLIGYGMPDGSIATLDLNENGTFELIHNQAGGEFAMECGASDGFFGLGSQVTGMDLRGRTFPMWTQEQGNGKIEGGGTFPFNNTLEAAYAPMGVLHSTAGWTGVITNDAYSEIDTCVDGFVKVRTYKAKPGLQMLLGTPKERMKQVSDIVGKVGSVPDWVFSLWLDAVGGPWRLTDVADRLRANAIPSSAIWTEDWIGGNSTATGYRLSYAWEWDQDFYPDLPAQVADLHNRGFAFLAYFNPFVPKPTRMFTEGTENFYLISNDDMTPTVFTDPAFRDASMIDLTNPTSLAWLKGYQTKAVTEIGVDGWMADFAEWLPVDTNLADAGDPWLFHNPYTLAWQRANRDALQTARPDGNWTFFVRSGWASTNGGTGGAAPLFWGGDQNTTWDYGDGFPTIIPIGVHVGLSGVPIYGSDIAGYNSVGGLPTTTKELWFRWLATAAFHPLMRTHHGGMECENWHFDRDAESIAHMKRYATVHALLLPYFKRLLAQANDDGLPMTRHPWLVEPDRPELWTGDQYAYFLGDDLLIAPVLAENTTTRSVRLPGDGWWPLFGNAPVDGNALDALIEVSTAAAVTEIPVFVRPGTVLELLAVAPDSFYGGTVSNLGDVGNQYRVALYPDRNQQAAGEGALGISATDLQLWSTTNATLDGTPLPACGPTTQNCVDGNTVRVSCIGTCEVLAGATLTITASTASDVQIGIAGDVWGDLAQPGQYTPSSETGTWCEEAPL